MAPPLLVDHYLELQQQVGWTRDDAMRVRNVSRLLNPILPELIEGIHSEIEQQSQAEQIVGNRPSVERFKEALIDWLQELLRGTCDGDHVFQRWCVHWQQLGTELDAIYTSTLFVALRQKLIREIGEQWIGPAAELIATIGSLNLLFDLDLAVIQEAYAAEHDWRRERTERLEAFEKLAEGISRELGKPLSTRKRSVYYLKNARDLRPEKLGEHLGRIDREANILDSLMTALAEFANPAIPEMNPFDVSAAIQESVIGLQTPAEIDIRVQSPGDVFALGDVKQIQTVLGNLFRNAVDAMPECGAMSVVAQQRNGGVEIQVCDTGIGIEPNAFTKIMDPLYTTKAHGMVSGVAHECRNVMQRIQSHAELLRLDLDDRPAALKHINKILEANECLRMILNELRDYSGPIVLTKENVEITTPIQRAWDSLFTVPARQGATLHVVCGESCGALCDVDPMRMEQVFRNLFENSIAASDPPPNIEVNLCKTVMGEQDMLQVSIRDNGPGFSELQRQHAFEPFFTTKKAGTGLGLPISKRIIEAHRGDIAIATTTAGAHITVTLPRSVCPAESVPSGELEPSL